MLCKMIESVTKSSPYSQMNVHKYKVVNKAFQSLSFRRGYSNTLITNAMNKSETYKSITRTKTYGAIMHTKLLSGKELYALVQGRYTGKWSFPKGHSNDGEQPFECAIREVAEETGIDTLPIPTNDVKIGYGNYFVFRLGEPLPLIPRDTNEIMDTKWVTLEEMSNLSLNADVSQFLRLLTL